MNQHLSTDILTDYVHGELAPAEDALVHAHLATCRDCRVEYDLERTLVDALRSAARRDEVEMPSLVRAHVWERIREARPSPFGALTALFRPVVAVPLAAILVVGGFFASPLARPGAAPPTVDATYYLHAHAAQARFSPFSYNGGTMETSMESDGSSARGSIVASYEADAVPSAFDVAVR